VSYCAGYETAGEFCLTVLDMDTAGWVCLTVLVWIQLVVMPSYAGNEYTWIIVFNCAVYTVDI
jgi:hypothetical protein